MILGSWLEKRHGEKKVVLRETSFKRFDIYLLSPCQFTRDVQQSQCHPPLVTYCSFRLNTNRKPHALGLAGIAPVSMLQQSDGQGEILRVVPVVLLTSGTIHLNHNHTAAPTIKMKALVKYKSIESSLVNETCEF